MQQVRWQEHLKSKMQSKIMKMGIDPEYRGRVCTVLDPLYPRHVMKLLWWQNNVYSMIILCNAKRNATIQNKYIVIKK
jgi:hypothetical protein